jgi:hypothetical protein
MAMMFRDTTWKGARKQPDAGWRNSVALYQIHFDEPYHKLSRWFLWNRRTLCGVQHHFGPNDYVLVNRNHLDRWRVCPECARQKGF